MLILLFPTLSPIGAEAATASFTSPSFATTWNRVDKPLEELTNLGRGYTWGPTVPNSENVTNEVYNGQNRKVQYFDKARMEINNPDANPNDLFYVTTGLLVKELVTGQRQDGDNSFTTLPPSTVQVAGDPNDGEANAIAPTYASFSKVGTFSGNENGKPSALGSPINTQIDKAGNLSTLNPVEPRLISGYDNVTQHNIADVFVDYSNQQGQVWSGNTYTQAPLFFGNATYVMGRPVTEPYWTRAVVSGVEKDVMVQLFERRVLTYTPSNPVGFKVEMGNVGQHYFKWRYVLNPINPTPPAATAPITAVPDTMLDFSQYRAQYHQSGPIPQGGVRSLEIHKTDAFTSGSFAIDDQNQLIIVGDQTEGVYGLRLDDPGIKAWTYQVVGDRIANFDATPTVFNGVAYIGSTTGRVFAINTKDGSLKWISQAAADRVIGAPIVAGNQVFFGSRDGRVYGVDINSGQLLSKSDDLGGPILAGLIFGKRETIYVVTAPKFNEKNVPSQVYALDFKGKKRTDWQVPTLTGNIYATPSYANNTIYVGTDMGWLYALRIDGTIRFQRNFPGDAILTTPAVYDTRVFVGTDKGYVYGLSADNIESNIKWVVKTNGKVRSSAAAIDGYVYFGSNDEQVYKVSVYDNNDLMPMFGWRTTAKSTFGYNSPIVYKGKVYIIDDAQRLYVLG
ncbi:MAG: PQQ-binding-like beta-propeller repeat protein [Chloroflexota bacterium]